MASFHGRVDVRQDRKKSFLHDWVKGLGAGGAIFLPSRRPEYNPTELCFSYVKNLVRRKMQNRTGEASVEEMIELIDDAFNNISKEIVEKWVEYACYNPNPKDKDKRRNNPLCKTITLNPKFIQTMKEKLYQTFEQNHSVYMPALDIASTDHFWMKWKSAEVYDLNNEDKCIAFYWFGCEWIKADKDIYDNNLNPVEFDRNSDIWEGYIYPKGKSEEEVNQIQEDKKSKFVYLDLSTYIGYSDWSLGYIYEKGKVYFDLDNNDMEIDKEKFKHVNINETTKHRIQSMCTYWDWTRKNHKTQPYTIAMHHDVWIKFLHDKTRKDVKVQFNLTKLKDIRTLDYTNVIVKPLKREKSDIDEKWRNHRKCQERIRRIEKNI